MVTENYHRDITHTRYLNKKLFDKGMQSWLPKEITDHPIELSAEGNPFINENYWVANYSAHIAPLWGGGAALLIVILFSFGSNKWDFMSVFVYVVSIIIVVVSVIYYFTMPKKEFIWNRKEGTVTFPGFMWQPNITMRFDDIKFTFSSGGANMVGGYMLRIVRPTRFGMLANASLAQTCYEDLSLWTWYMDRNRPLPPGELFDPFREIDFQRRKAEGFPPPLYKSHIPIPEYVPEEIRKRIEATKKRAKTIAEKKKQQEKRDIGEIEV